MEIMRNGVHIPSVPVPLSIRLASDYRDSAVTAPIPSTSALTDMTRLPKERPVAESPMTVARQIIKKQQNALLPSLPNSKLLASSKKLAPRLTEQCIKSNTEHQIRPVFQVRLFFFTHITKASIIFSSCLTPYPKGTWPLIIRRRISSQCPIRSNFAQL